MPRLLIFGVLIIAVVFLSVSLLFSIQHNKNLVQAKNTLILQNDSLQILQIQSRKEIAGIKGYLDSILIRENRKDLSTK